MTAGAAPLVDATPRWLLAWLGAPGFALAAAWGFAEGALFFVVPDVLFTLTALFSIKRGFAQLGTAVCGALIAGVVMYTWASSAPVQARAAVAAVPFVGEKMIAPAEARWDAGGTSSLFTRPLNGVPYKVYAVLAPPRLTLGEFLVASVPLRAERMALSMIVFLPVAWLLRRRPIAERRRRAIRFHVLFWTVVYCIYWPMNVS